MQFEIENLNKSINDLMRTIGYQSTHFQKPGETSIVRQLGGNDYPRFHLYIKEEGSPSVNLEQVKGKNIIFSLHLDQKKPSYDGSHAHSGEYDGELVESEAERIKNILSLNK